ncbi:MAG: transporter substrate-binding domain-containing protein [Comamonadaceae bacterium]|nr:MAG: transporter substrate-binding domain-containing protein [Comamonadaceae bacterium]
MWFKFSLLQAVIGFALVSSAAAQSPAVTPAAPGASPAPVSTIASIKSSGAIRIGLRQGAAPFSYFEAGDKPAGFSWALCSAIVQEMSRDLGVPVAIKITPVDLKSSFEKLAAGSIDLQCGSTTHTLEREKIAGFSNTFFVAGIRIAHRKGEAEFANGQRYGRVLALENSTAATIVNRRLGETAQPPYFLGRSVFKTYQEGVDKLKAKQGDTLFADAVLLPLDDSIEFQDKPVTVEPYALLTRKGDTEFIALVNKAMAKVLAARGEAMAAENGLKGRINGLTRDAWRRPSSDAALSLY